ncbi:MAG: response regulator [Candidatus Hydrothermarchaeaceae archaeon]
MRYILESGGMPISQIMVVDDEDDIRYLIGAILKKAGHDVVTASSGEECLKILKTERPDLILLDVMMPGLDGFDTCAVIKSDEESRSIPVAMLTVKSGDEDRLRSLEECAADWHISKPVDRKKLVEIVDWLLKSPPRSFVRK